MRFANTVYSKIDTLIKYSDIGRYSPKNPTIQFINIDKHRQMFDEFDGIELTIVDFWDMRQEPKKRKY
jgi:hypothetical protein